MDIVEYKNAVGIGTVITKFYTNECKPCKMMSSILESVKNDVPELSIIEIDAEEDWELSQELGIRSVPVMFLYKDGESVKKFVGLTSKEDIVSELK